MVRALGTAAFLCAIIFLDPRQVARAVLGQATDSGAGVAMVLAQATQPDAVPTPQRTTKPEKRDRDAQEDRVEVRIKELHRQLKITPAQEPQWNAFAQVMLENAREVDAVLNERSRNLHAMNAVEDLRSYEKLTDAHADGLKKLVPAFEALYETMSEDQKKTADAVFAKHERRPRHASK